ncbi:MAG: Histone family protein DNA-binding protein [Candidatus Woesebacteria bacterium GW2011_GWA1_39_21]|uniref:Histone family protein DNA-binding protein n=1 Tax=Candidatus Woesebacteria bacterium GW2011_GWA1_39_21 TaxID=1618550 RepID=A0A0G0QMR7_9BACT|nr:MAG: Histone family protein DNA-binding protein [Candidatus Woesebacteria bacterium GW2011_GWA1_39_21]
MTKREITELVARKAHMTTKAAREAIDVFLDEIGRALSKGEKRIVLSGFGVFKVGWVEGKTVKIPKSEKLVTIKRHRLPKFTPGTELRKQISR